MFQSNSPIKALGESVSFGRFMTESLAWEKFSTFSHNRYVEEAERFSKPGSVAQKKAFFEAHYKKLAAQKAAAALLEQTKSNEEELVDNTNNSDENAKSSNADIKSENKVDGAQLEKEHQTFVGNSMQNHLDDVENADTHSFLSEKVSGMPPVEPKINLILLIWDLDSLYARIYCIHAIRCLVS